MTAAERLAKERELEEQGLSYEDVYPNEDKGKFWKLHAWLHCQYDRCFLFIYIIDSAIVQAFDSTYHSTIVISCLYLCCPSTQSMEQFCMDMVKSQQHTIKKWIPHNISTTIISIFQEKCCNNGIFKIKYLYVFWNGDDYVFLSVLILFCVVI